MSVPYDVFIDAFLSKITEFEFIELPEESRTAIVDGYMKRAMSDFRRNCKYDFVSCADDGAREYAVDIPDNDMDEIVEIVSEGMLVQWMKPYIYRQEILENTLSTRDFTTYSPAELLNRVRQSYGLAQRDYIQKIREYSYNHGDLSDLHL